MEMTAIAFAAPGIGVAEALLFGQDMKSTNRLTSITVQPQNDIVSRIDPGLTAISFSYLLKLTEVEHDLNAFCKLCTTFGS